ncbi:MAG: hypothetical protein Q8Q49_00445 [bacterium]|nr:hypothetical protein [bacterium]
MSSENLREQEKYSGSDFIRELEARWGGRLFFAVTPELEGLLSDIKVPSRDVFAAIAAGRFPAASLSEEELELTGNPVEDFKACAIRAMPHPDEAEDFVHLLADPFCRALLAEQLEWFMQPSLPPQPDGIFATVSIMPFELEGPDSIVFQAPFFLPTPRHYFDAAKKKSGALSQQLDIAELDRQRFAIEFERGMDGFADYTELVLSGDHLDDKPSIVKTVSHLAAAQFLFKPRPSAHPMNN